MKDPRYKCSECNKVLDTNEVKFCECCKPMCLPGDAVTQIAVDASKKRAAEFYRKNITALYSALGFDRGQCRSCGKNIWWVITKNGKRAPYTADGISHFADCKHANQHRKGERK